MRTRRSFLVAVTGLALLGTPGLAQTPPRRRFGCSDHDAGDPSWAHGSDNDRGARSDPVLRYLNQDATDRGAVSDATSHRRNRPQLFCPPRKRQRRARPAA